MIENLKINHVIDPKNPQEPTVTGIYTEILEVNGSERRALCFIPEKVRSSTSAVFVFGKNGVSAEQLYNESNWAELAQTDERKEKFIVFYLEALDGVWNLDDPQDDLAYVHELFNISRGRTKYCVHEAKYYLVGYGEGGTIAQMAAMDDPAVYAGVASVDAPDVKAEFAEMNAESACISLNGYEDTDNRYHYKKGQFFVPSWIITSDDLEVTGNGVTAKYWRSAGETDVAAHMVRPDVAEYFRSKEAPWTVNQEKEAFRVWVGKIDHASDGHGKNVNRRIWADFLRNVRKWMAEPGGDLRMTYDPVVDLGMEYHYEEIGGYMREYYVYVPKSMRAGYTKACPLVFAMHGYSCSGEIYTGNSEWFKVAEDNGFIVVFPSATHGHIHVEKANQAASNDDTELPAWNIYDLWEGAPDELNFFDTMIERICEKYLIDRTRIYATGHSLGSLMTQLLGMARPKTFAAIAPCSGVLFLGALENFAGKESVKNRVQVELPVWMFGGEREEWLLDAVPLADNQTGKSIYSWWDLNRMDSPKPEEFESFRSDDGRWKHYVFNKNSVPMIRYTWVEELPHATMTEMSYLIWNDYFSHIRREENGEIIYE